MILDKRGGAGRIMTSVVALVIIFFMMLIYVLVSIFVFSLNDNIDNFGSEGLSNEKLDSEILLDIFLKDKVIVDGSEMTVEKAIKEIEYNSDKIKFMKPVQERFHEVYACGARNKLVVLHYGPEGFYFYIKEYIDYPGTLNNLKLPEEIEDSGTKYGEICDNNQNSRKGFAKEFTPRYNAGSIVVGKVCVFVEENVIC